MFGDDLEMPVGGQKGNKNSSRSNRLWGDTIRRAIDQSDGKRLRTIAEKLLDKAAEGDIQAIRELGDRLDGKPHQSMDLEATGKGGAPLFPSVNVVVDAMKGEK